MLVYVRTSSSMRESPGISEAYVAEAANLFGSAELLRFENETVDIASAFNVVRTNLSHVAASTRPGARSRACSPSDPAPDGRAIRSHNGIEAVAASWPLQPPHAQTQITARHCRRRDGAIESPRQPPSQPPTRRENRKMMSPTGTVILALNEIDVHAKTTTLRASPEPRNRNYAMVVAAA